MGEQIPKDDRVVPYSASVNSKPFDTSLLKQTT
jgi:hypothetical protein